MEIKYTNRLSDIIAFNFLALFKRRLSLVLLIAISALISFRHARQISAEYSIIVSVISFILLFLFISAILLSIIFLLTIIQILLTHSKRTDKGFLAKHTLEVSPEGFIEESPVNRTESKWAGVYRIRKGINHIYIYTGPNKAHIIPLRAFETKEEFRGFYSDLMNLYNKKNS
jgi:predicted membrane protein